MKSAIFSLLLLVSFLTYAQNPLSYYVGDYSWKYTVVTPPGKAKGLIVFIPGFTETSESFLDDVTIHEIGYKYGLTTLVMPFGSKLFADKEAIQMLNEALTKVMSDHDIPKNKVVFGGLSVGGSIALRYAEFCKNYAQDYPANPQGIFLIDSPVDLSMMYQTYSNQLNSSEANSSMNHALQYKNLLERDLKGSPDINPQNYRDYSPFTLNDADGGNIKVLKNTAIRSYHGMDFMQHLYDHQLGFMSLHSTVASEMIAQLMRMGNTEAELILTRCDHDVEIEDASNVFRSIDELDLLIWILNQLDIPVNSTINNSNTGK